MSADIRLIRLSRRTNSKRTEDTENIKNSNDLNNANDPQQYLSTDYFDVLHCVTKKSEDSFCSIMGIGERASETEKDIAIQSYALSCSNETLSKYEGKECYEDPFKDLGENKHFLSLIQVYITPEVTARVCQNDMSSPNDFLSKIEDDIHEILNDFVLEKEPGMSYRVYNMLSTGDFAVVVRSIRAETSFEISTALRKRYVEVEDDSATNLVLYKTFTLLTMADSVINADIQPVSDTEKASNQFVIRCCYSNKYWSEKEQVDEFWREKRDKVELLSLNGRYDVTLSLTEQEFKAVFPFIAEYKYISKDNKLLEGFDEDQIEDRDGVNYLKYLMKNKYVSYVNERYLLGSISPSADTKDQSLLEPVKGRKFVDQANVDKYNRVKERHKKVEAELQKLHTNRRDLLYYMDLLHKLLQLCHAINSLSDTRIYVSVLLEQILVLLDSMNHYIDSIDKNNEDYILGLMEDYLKESVGALDKYSQYIRNNNLQSLQTPNYNIESNTSMEKLLIAYSEFVHKFIEYYMNSEVAKDAGQEGDIKEYIPIVVPDLMKDSVSVEVMFPGWIPSKATDGVQKGGEASANTFLMIITCPTLRELGDVPAMMASLFHEIAHQFRYEKRATRNEVILKYTLENFFEIIAMGIVKEFNLNTGTLDIHQNLVVMFRDSMRDAFLEIWCPDPESGSGGVNFSGSLHKNREAPLAFFEQYILEDVDLFLKSWNSAEPVLTCVKKFIGGISPYILAGTEDRSSLLEFERLVADIISSENYDDDAWREILNGFQKEALKVYESCVVSFIDNEDVCQQWRNSWKEALANCVINGGSITIPWDAVGVAASEDLFSELDKATKAKLKEIREIVRGFFLRLEDLREDWEQCGLNAARQMNKCFGQVVYKKICAAWAENSKKCMGGETKNLPMLQELDEAGRYYGFDYKTTNNQNIFWDLLSRNITNLRIETKVRICSDINNYREETADLFMCSAIQLNLTGYINLMAQKLPIDAYVPDIHLTRIMRVAAAKWCSLKSADFGEFYKAYRKQCVLLLKDTVRYVDEMAYYYKIEGWRNQEIIEWDSDSGDELACRFAGQIEELLDCVRGVKTENRECKCDLIHAESMLKIIYYMVQNSFQPLCKFYENEVIRQDYIKGVKTLNKLKLEDWEEKGVTIEALCTEIKKIMNEPWKKYQGILGELNPKIIKFLLNMHCENKRRNAGKTGETSYGC